MQRIWTVVLSVWAMLAIVAVLAWSHRPIPAPPPQAAAQTFVVKNVNGTKQLVAVQPAAVGAPHAVPTVLRVRPSGSSNVVGIGVASDLIVGLPGF